MPNLDRAARKLDDRSRTTTGGGSIIETGGAAAAPAVTLPAPPSGFRATGTALVLSAVTPKALVNLEWRAPVGVPVAGYVVQWATEGGFAVPVGLPPIAGEATTMAASDLPCGVTIWFRIATVARGGVRGEFGPAISQLTASDTVPPAPPSAVSAAFLVDGTLHLRCTNPTSQNFRHVEARIYNGAGKQVEYDLLVFATGEARWPAARNRQQSVGSPDGSPDPTVYLELQSRSWGGLVSTIVSATATKARPADVAGVGTTWDGATGTCTWRWTPVPDAVGYRLTLTGAGIPGGSLTRTLPPGGEYVYTLAQNRLDHSAAPTPANLASIAWSLVAVDALDQTSLTPAAGTATLAPPATPTGIIHPWQAGADLASADWSIDCTTISGVVKRILSIDGISRDLPVSGRYSYPVTLNAQEHGGAPDPSLAWSLVWADALGQTSLSPASGTAINLPPPAVSITLAGGGMTSLGIIVGQSAALDLRDYRVRIYRDLALVDTLWLGDTIRVTEQTMRGSYTADVTPFDQFGQGANVTTSAAVALDPLTIAQLREALTYRDHLGTTAATLAVLADDVRVSGGQAYSAGSGWGWTEADWQQIDRIGTIWLTATAGQGCLGLSRDGATYDWFSGPLVGERLTYIGTGAIGSAAEVSAQAAALTLPTSTTGLWEIPPIYRARFVRLGHRNVGAGYTLREFLPRRLVEADDMRAEFLRARHVGVGVLVGDHIFGTTLAAIKASLGTVTIDPSGCLRSGQTAYDTGTGYWLGHAGGVPKLSLGTAGGQGLRWDGSALSVSGAFNLSGVATIGASGGLYQGTGSFAAPTTGLKIWNEGGIGRLVAYGGGVAQVGFDSSGRLFGGGGNVLMDANGLRVTPYATSNGVANNNGYTFSSAQAGQSDYGLYAGEDGASRTMRLRMRGTQGTQQVVIQAFGDAGGLVSIEAGGANAVEDIALRLNRSDARLTGSLRIGTAGSLIGAPALPAGDLAVSGAISGASLSVSGAISGGSQLSLGSASATFGHGTAWLAGAFPGIKFNSYYGAGSKQLDLSAAENSLVIQRRTRGTDAYEANLWSLNQYGNMWVAAESAIRSTAYSDQSLRIGATTDTSTSYPLLVHNASGATLFYVRGDGTVSPSSDRRLKADIANIAPAAGLAVVQALQPSTYTRGGIRTAGLIAQDVIPVLPDLVGAAPDGTLTLNYYGLVPYLIAAVQALAARQES